MVNKTMSWLKKIESFTSVTEFKRFQKYLSDRIQDGEIEEVEPKEHYFGRNTFNRDRWFKDLSTNEIWTLVHPDFPFLGFFEKVEYPLETAHKEE